jgi:hypothetical protein
MQLHLNFAGGIMEGDGRDRCGPFTIRGRYDLKSAEVTFTKGYQDYEVFYKGWAELDKGIWRLWQIPLDWDGFHIWPKGMPDPTRSTLEKEADVPSREEENVVLVGDI